MLSETKNSLYALIPAAIFLLLVLYLAISDLHIVGPF